MTATVHTLYDELPNDKPILIPDGEYRASYVRHQTWLFRGQYPKLIITFAIQDFGEFYLKHICAFYNVKKLTGKPKIDGHFSLGWRSSFMFDYSTCFGTPPRKDRISMCRFKNVLVDIKTRIVARNREQREYPEGMRYSVVDHIIGVAEL